MIGGVVKRTRGLFEHATCLPPFDGPHFYELALTSKPCVSSGIFVPSVSFEFAVCTRSL